LLFFPFSSCYFLKQKKPFSFSSTAWLLKNQKPAVVAPKQHVQQREKEAEVCEEQLSRTAALYGEKGMKHIKDSFVIVVGLGGVGRFVGVCLFL
jgi:hypothetical protein